MPKVAVVDMNGKKIEDIELNDAVFGIEPNVPVMHQAVRFILPTSAREPSPLLPVPRSPAAAASPGNRREPAMHVRDRQDLRSGLTAV